MTALEITAEIIAGFSLFGAVWVAAMSGQALISGFKAVADPRDSE